MHNISIATPSDIDDLCTLLILLMEQEADFTPDIEAHKRGLSDIINSPKNGLILKIEVNEKIVGMINILFSISTALGGRVAILEDFIIKPGYRNKGYGKLLFKEAIEEAKQSKCKRISLLTDHDNDVAHAFYKAHGMEKSTMVTFRKLL